MDITANRAKYHAMRQPGAGTASPHRELYALVDVIYRHIDDNGHPRRGWTEYDYTFSGHTLENVRLATDWPD